MLQRKKVNRELLEMESVKNVNDKFMDNSIKDENPKFVFVDTITGRQIRYTNPFMLKGKKLYEFMTTDDDGDSMIFCEK